jgi:hypothetical protein
MRKSALKFACTASLVLGASQFAAGAPADGAAIKAAAEAPKPTEYVGFYRSPYLSNDYYRPYWGYTRPYRPYWGYGNYRPYRYRPYRRYRYGR